MEEWAACLPPTGIVSPLHPWILWYLRAACNKLMFENLSLTEEEALLRATKEARGWQDEQKPSRILTP